MQVQFIQTTPEKLQEQILEGVKSQLEQFLQKYKPKQPQEYLTRREVAEMFKIDLSSVHNWTKKGILQAYQIAGRVYYKRTEIESAIVKLNK